MPLNDPIVSVIIAAYNAERFIRRSIESALAQTYSPFEIIVIDDGSKDGTGEIVEREFGGRVKLISQANGGVSRARNAGIREAAGKYVAFLDADDWWDPRKLELQFRCMEQNPDAVANYTGLTVIDSAHGERIEVPPFDQDKLWPSLRWCNPGVPPSSVMLRRTELLELGGFSEGLLAAEDWELWFKLLRKGSFTTLQEPLTFYVSSPTGLSGDAELMYASFLQILDTLLLDDLKGISKAIWRRRIISYQAYKSCLTARAAGDGLKERQYLWQSVRTWPSVFWAPKRFRAFGVTLMRSKWR